MSTIRIDEVSGKGLDRVTKILAGVPGGVYKAVSSALKRAGDTAKTKAGQMAAAEYTISKGTFMRNVKIKNLVSSHAGGVASMSLSFAGGVLPLLNFNTKFSKDGRITTQVKRNGGGGTLEHAFVSNMFGATAVFERVGTSRFPVEQKYGPSTAHMMQNDDVIEKMSDAISETYDKRIEHEITRILNGWGG